MTRSTMHSVPRVEEGVSGGGPRLARPSAIRGRWAAAIMLVAGSLADHAVRGDESTAEVHRVGGGVVRGEVAGLSPNEVAVTTQTGSTTRIPIEDVDFVRFADEPEALTRARTLLSRGDGSAAGREIATIADSDRATTTKPVLVDIAFVKAAAAGRVAITTGTGLDQAAEALRDFAAANPKSHHLYATHEMLGGVWSRAGRQADAATAYGEMAKGPPAIVARGATLKAGLELEQGRPVEAIREFERAAAAAAEVAGEAGRRTRLAAELGKARCLLRLGKPEDAIAACRGVIGRCRPNDADLLSRSYLLLGAAQLQTGSADHDAVVSLLTVELVHNTVPEDRAEAIHHLIGAWERLNHPERAREARQLLETTYPNSPWTRKPPAANPS